MYNCYAIKSGVTAGHFNSSMLKGTLFKGIFVVHRSALRQTIGLRGVSTLAAGSVVCGILRCRRRRRSGGRYIYKSVMNAGSAEFSYLLAEHLVLER